MKGCHFTTVESVVFSDGEPMAHETEPPSHFPGDLETPCAGQEDLGAWTLRTTAVVDGGSRLYLMHTWEWVPA